VNPGRFWIGLVVALLVGNAVAVGVLIAESGDPSARIEADYYRRAVAWDDTMAERSASAALGWRIDAVLVEQGRGAAVEVRVYDAAGLPVAGARVEAAVHHRSVAAGAPRALRERAPGRYRRPIAGARPGLHVVDVVVERGADRFVASALVERPVAGEAR
jgi:nitrogen fixation protein FixH